MSNETHTIKELPVNLEAAIEQAVTGQEIKPILTPQIITEHLTQKEGEIPVRGIVAILCPYEGTFQYIRNQGANYPIVGDLQKPIKIGDAELTETITSTIYLPTIGHEVVKSLVEQGYSLSDTSIQQIIVAINTSVAKCKITDASGTLGYYEYDKTKKKFEKKKNSSYVESSIASEWTRISGRSDQSRTDEENATTELKRKGIIPDEKKVNAPNIQLALASLDKELIESCTKSIVQTFEAQQKADSTAQELHAAQTEAQLRENFAQFIGAIVAGSPLAEIQTVFPDMTNFAQRLYELIEQRQQAGFQQGSAATVQAIEAYVLKDAALPKEIAGPVKKILETATTANQLGTLPERMKNLLNIPADKLALMVQNCGNGTAEERQHDFAKQALFKYLEKLLLEIHDIAKQNKGRTTSEGQLCLEISDELVQGLYLSNLIGSDLQGPLSRLYPALKLELTTKLGLYTEPLGIFDPNGQIEALLATRGLTDQTDLNKVLDVLCQYQTPTDAQKYLLSLILGNDEHYKAIIQSVFQRLKATPSNKAFDLAGLNVHRVEGIKPAEVMQVGDKYVVYSREQANPTADVKFIPTFETTNLEEAKWIAKYLLFI